MKKKVSRSIVKAMAIGISAFAATSVTSVTALASDSEDNNELLEEDSKDAVAVDATTKDDATNATTDAKESGDSLVAAIEATKDVAQAVTDAKDDFDADANSEVTDGDETTKINNAEVAVGDTASNIDEANDATSKTNEAMDSADVNVDIVKEIASTAKEDVAKAKEEVDANIEAIKNATTKADAQAAYDKVQSIVNKAEEDYTAAQTAYDTAKSDYETAVENAKKADEEYKKAVEAAQANVEAAVAKLESVKANAETLQGELEEAQKAYEAAVAEAEAAKGAAEEAKGVADKALEDAKAAQQTADKELQDAKDATEAAQNALDEAQKAKEAADKAVEEAEAAKAANEYALKIIEQEKVVQAGSNNWTQADKLFDLIMQGYYVPYVVKPEEGSTVEYPKTGSYGFTKFGSKDVQNYYKIVITSPNGEKTELYMNYKFDTDKKNLIIFEKTLGEIEVSPAVPAKYVSVDTGLQIQLSEDEFASKLAAGEIFESNGFYYMKKATSEVTYERTTAENEKVDVNENTTVTVRDDSAQNSTLVETVTGTVTTTTYEQTGVSSENVYDSESAAREAAQNELSEGDQNLDISITSDTTNKATATVNFATTYTTTISLAGKVVVENTLWNSVFDDDGSLANSWMKSIASGLEKKGYYILSSDVSNVKAKKTKDNGLFKNDEYTYQSGTITISYAAATKTAVDYSTWDNIKEWVDDEKKKAITADLFEKDGSEVVDWNSWNGKLTTADVTLLTHETATGTATTDKNKGQAAKSAREDAVANAEKKATANAGNISGYVNSLVKSVVSGVKTSTTGKAMYKAAANKAVAYGNASVTKESSTTAYGYTGTYDKKVVTVEEDVVLKVTETAGDQLRYIMEVPAQTEEVYLNDNYDNYLKDKENNKDSISLFEKTDEAFRKFLDDATKSVTDLEEALKNQENAATKVDEAKKALDSANETQEGKQKVADEKAADTRGAQSEADAKAGELSKAEQALSDAKNATNYADLIELAKKTNADVATAQAKVDLLKTAVDNMKNSNIDDTILEVLGAKLSAAEAELKAAKDNLDDVKDNGDGAKKTLDDKLTKLTPITPAPVNPAPTPASVDPVAPADSTTNVAPAQATQTTQTTQTTIPDNNVALADGTEDTTEDTTAEITDNKVPLSESSTEEKTGDVAITDGEVPLIGGFDDDDDKKMSWWWLLIAALCGGTGYEVYKKNKKDSKKID